MQKSIDFIKKLKKELIGIDIIGGVVATYEGARDLFEAGAYKAGLEFDRPIIADGGTKTTGDIVKALAAGGCAVAMGNQLAGCLESPGGIIEINGKRHKAYNGSTSHAEKIHQYQQYSKDKTIHYVEDVEGIESYVPYKGPIKNVLDVMDKGIRSGLSYCGAQNIEELHQKAKFIRITQASIGENGAHEVFVNAK